MTMVFEMVFWKELTEEKKKDIVVRTLQIVKSELVVDFYKRFCEINPNTHATLKELYDFYLMHEKEWEEWGE